ncbi:DNA-3-methyladenine glycosylase 2 family protein [Pantoea sp. EABMAA-21]|uniref:DNA-3-methyladenine glycosylase family protein n=1 Tax=Enterobacterales TaxID=91347 RepID=UPI0024AEC70F|nr:MULTISPECIES: DNA-3-methyladenine glycosylase 2 family protein [Enterobacterales]MDI6934683.1 DNA-3-methyladenine glycosylase 2 family protein [Serratia sp. Se-PFBMAAmG]MDI9225790.1 DNA-3-methyladenine glycosylase 2 family protein [Serratia bockelmannii]MDI9223640.1 DNA-3-methyladenine glycosylase 2 family protein [Pantoea sp. EA-12]MDI9265888.1 DNA-3-methyladenine glycosylase 2 family protein [Serratia sp. PF2-63]MDI9267144.1 DNA-3-methyladenine glycosylase 2 family protein [Serratia sp. P
MSEICEASYERASLWLSKQPEWASLITRVGPCGHQAKPEREPYEALIRAIAYQQLTARAGDAILARLRAAFMTEASAFPSPAQLENASPELLRQCGFSTRKVATLQAIAQGARTGLVPGRKEAVMLSDEELVARLTSLKGIGRWTVEMLLIYTLERMDIMPLDDFGIAEGLHFLYAPEGVLSRRELRILSEKCAPYRTVASWYLWRIPQLPGYREFKASRPGR